MGIRYGVGKAIQRRSDSMPKERNNELKLAIWNALKEELKAGA